ncbi:MAG: hypothetical protein JRJ20_17985, partial [Deltaproteobacteria bacterium]|nr:hypothetical protein [Deltaproteobacteria bacterium]
MKKKTMLSGMLSVFLLFASAGTAFAYTGVLNEAYNRPNPLMDYVPQEIGTYDTVYQNLSEGDCRGCHGDTADRHHNTEWGQDCLHCHFAMP